MNRIILKVENFVRSAKMAGFLTGVMVSVVLGAASAVAGIYLQLNGLGLFCVPCVAVGCFLSGSIFAYQLKKVLDAHRAIVEADGRSGEADRRRVEEVEKQRDSCQEALARTRKEVEDLRSQRININSFSPILQISLIEADMKITDVCTEWKKDRFETHTFGGPTCEQYLGVLQKDFKVKFGVDMKNVAIEDRDGCLYVHGLQVVNTGLKDPREKWLLREMRTFTLAAEKEGVPEGAPDQSSCGEQAEGMQKEPLQDTSDRLWCEGTLYTKDLEAEGSISMDLNRLDADTKKQADLIQTRINRAECEQFQVAKPYVKKMVEEVLKCMLAPLLRKNRIEFLWDEPSIPSQSMPLVEYVSAYNAKLESSVAPQDQIELA